MIFDVRFPNTHSHAQVKISIHEIVQRDCDEILWTKAYLPSILVYKWLSNQPLLSYIESSISILLIFSLIANTTCRHRVLEWTTKFAEFFIILFFHFIFIIQRYFCYSTDFIVIYIYSQLTEKAEFMSSKHSNENLLYANLVVIVRFCCYPYFIRKETRVTCMRWIRGEEKRRRRRKKNAK